MADTIVTVAGLQATIARALAHAPQDRSRIERAAALIALGRVQRTAATEFTVESQTTLGVHYVVTPSGCTCVDAQRRPEQRCKHQWAARLVVAAERAATRVQVGRAA